MKIRFMFLRDRKNAPVGCLAIVVSEDMFDICYQYSVLNPEDGFNRSLSRELAAGRLVTKPCNINGTKRFNGIHDITRAVMTDLSDSDAPTRAKRAAKLWLKSPIKSAEIQ